MQPKRPHVAFCTFSVPAHSPGARRGKASAHKALGSAGRSATLSARGAPASASTQVRAHLAPTRGPKSESLVAGAAAGRTDSATRRFTPRSQRSDARSWAQTSLQPAAENKRTAKNTCLVEPKAAVVSTGASVAPCSLPRRGARQNRFVLGLCAPHGAPATSPTRARAARCEAHRRGRPACVQTLPAPRRRKGGGGRSTQSAPTGTTRTCRETRHGELEAL